MAKDKGESKIGGEGPPPPALVLMVRDAPWDGAATEGNCHPEEVANWQKAGWRIKK
jgi:hypothetical protein